MFSVWMSLVDVHWHNFIRPKEYIAAHEVTSGVLLLRPADPVAINKKLWQSTGNAWSASNNYDPN